MLWSGRGDNGSTGHGAARVAVAVAASHALRRWTVSVAEVGCCTGRHAGTAYVDRSIQDDIFHDVSCAVVDLSELEFGTDVDAAFNVIVGRLYNVIY